LLKLPKVFRQLGLKMRDKTIIQPGVEDVPVKQHDISEGVIGQQNLTQRARALFDWRVIHLPV
jgi:hypothetical protein